MGITFKAEVKAGSQYYGTVEIRGITQDDGAEVKVQKYLKATLALPATVHSGDVNLMLNPWHPIEASTENTQTGSDRFDVTVKMACEADDTSFAVGPSDTLTIGVNGDLTGDAAQRCVDSIRISADD